MRLLKVATALTALAMVAAGCSGGGASAGGSTGSASDIKLEGKLGTSSSFVADDNSAMAVTLGDLKIYAIAFSNPPIIKEANLETDGSFSLTLPGAKGNSITAIFKDKNDDSQVGTVVFEDTSKKGLDGKSKKNSAIVLTDSVALGNITLGSDGKVTIPVSQIASSTGSTSAPTTGTAFDMTGVWTMSAYDGTMDSGYVTAGSDCNQGPCVGMNMTLVRLAGKEFTPNGGACIPNGTTGAVTCAEGNGTVGSADRYGLSLWLMKPSEGVQACQGLGFTRDEVRAFGGIHIANGSIALGGTFGNAILAPVTFTTDNSVFGGNPAPWNQPWMKTNGTAAFSIPDCRSVSVGTMGVEAWACKGNIQYHTNGTMANNGQIGWSVGISQGGCKDASTNKPVNVNNWGMAAGSCGTPTDVSSQYQASAGSFYKYTCSYSNFDHDGNMSTPAISVECTNTHGMFANSSNAPNYSSPISGTGTLHVGQPLALISAGAACSQGTVGAQTSAGTLAAYRCYSNAYYEAKDSANMGGCERDYRFNYSATEPYQFVSDGNKGHSRNSIVTNILDYSADGKTAILEDEKTATIAVPVSQNNSVFCEIAQRIRVNVKEVSTGKLLVNFAESGQMNSTDAACQGVAKQALACTNNCGYDGVDLQHMLKGQKFIFYLNK